MGRSSPHLVQEHLELISGEVFEEFGAVITGLVGGRNGIYALYDGDRLYYVGLATDLKTRLKAHLRDRHKDLWDRFSVYVTNGDAHMKELESLMLRVIQPQGNRVKGRLHGSQDQRGELERRIKHAQQALLHGIIGKATASSAGRPSRPAAKRVRPAAKNSRTDGLRGHGATGVVFLRAQHKGRTYKATLHTNGQVKVGGTLYPSLSAAGQAVTKRSTNGRTFWRVRTADGTWVSIGSLEV
ncbi:MAG: DUF2924 domain-containing protein [Flavobacteriales bacterium]|nr:DUF2924 domain-containing protein [Flavobacteriales bacterium]